MLKDNKCDQQTPDDVKVLTALASKVSHAFVTGAGGFLGKAICRYLRNAGIAVTGFARGDYPDLEQMGVTMVKGDISDKTALMNAMQGCDLVFHVASKAGVWGSKADYYSPNVDGARNILDACQALCINKLVYTSTPSVTFAGFDEAGIDESAPYADNYLNYYAESKAIAEQMVLAASGRLLEKTSCFENINSLEKIDSLEETASLEESDCLKGTDQQLKTVALRPHLIWGPEDPHLVPRVIDRARAGRLKLVGREDKLVDTIYVDNAAYAHILAALRLSEPQAVCAGKAYFLSNDEPITMAAMLNKILSCAELPPVRKRVPTSLAYGVGALLEWIYGWLGKKQEPVMTRFVARQLSTCHYFDISAAKRDLGYVPVVSIEEGMKRLKASLSRC
ncbi:NAD-dependent epimerase/dehydratase family protein [Photobacterium lipolyticum]|uniref:NAD-dependent epimerase/dehydratase family protein n=1 Tax=Photobacterium lipolyticum TaxID=266810 RepID=UPI001FE5FB48|nr:NAD-dependent epimerase/dehydratase family protein [Photobacterium lipolyticum]